MTPQTEDGVSAFLSGARGDDEGEVGGWRARGEEGVDEALADGEAEATAYEDLARALGGKLEEGLACLRLL